ncbi:MAG: hypothetical protein NWT08_08965 [Akkermansiaceae bacterium]|nr:hypothetical protein [Akkermansiaceae bacterium]MDP4647120.1 hypothetical protein [Akkermansiaceae bacterium]MDP4722590.1 hypothetical protein [Akkermansiaceae bacterium]MDP4780414.1 hypothetical protein [Akkermansiaceae bacterium]MDP4847731.1 hypothetical protein [Akkermansiaceae bacterium]
MKPLFLALALCTTLHATTISIVPIHEPISLQGTDVDEIITETGEALQANVLSRPMALTGAFPETLVEAIRTSHKIPTNNPNYTVEEANLLILCNVGISARATDEGLLVELDVSELKIPMEVDLTSRQLLKLTLIAVNRTLEAYHSTQTDPLTFMVSIEGVTEKNASLRDLEVTIKMEHAAP